MVALIIVLNHTDYLDDILAKFIHLGVRGATIIDSQGMASAIVQGEIYNIPLFGSLKTTLSGASPYNKTIFTVINDTELLEKTMSEVEDLLRKNGKTSAGFMFTLPVGKMITFGSKLKK